MKASDVVYHPLVAVDVREAQKWYEDKKRGLGKAFFDEIEHALEVIESNPRLFQKISHEIRIMRIKRFPYSIVYECIDKNVYILGIQHVKRHPDTWKSRLEE